MELLAAKATELLTLAQTTNATAEIFIQLPSTIGNKQYWLQLGNDSAKAWVDGGFGKTPQYETELRVYMLNGFLASGCYLAGYGTARLKCHFENGVACVILSDFTGGE
jgi:hypothetical protein